MEEDKKGVIIYPGNDLKFRIDFNLEGFDPTVNSWSLLLRNEFRKLKVTKEDLLVDDENHFYITQKARPGKTFVTTTCDIPDNDFSEGIRQEIDKQLLYEPYCSVPDYLSGLCRHDHWVSFVRVWMSDLNDDGLIVLMDRNGDVIHDRNGNPIYVHRFNKD